MIEIFIDSQLCDLTEDFALPSDVVSFTTTPLSDIAEQRRGRRVELLLPCSSCNDALLLYPCDAVAGERFNASYHRGSVVVDGVELIGGVAHLEGIEVDGLGDVEYRVSIVSGGAEWVERAAQTPLGETSISYSATLNGEEIEASWSGDRVVRWFPVRRDEYPSLSESLHPVQKMMSDGDYHPFVSVAGLVEGIFDEAGYELQSSFFQGEEFRRLYISGAVALPSTSSERLNSLCGFCAKRLSEASTTADSFGRAYLTPLVLTHSLGNFVESADSRDAEGLYNNSSALRWGESGLEYLPPIELSVGFEYYLHYTTSYRMLSRERLQGFDGVYLGAGCDIRYHLNNPYTDRRGRLQSGNSYRVVVFGSAADATYRLVQATAEGSSVVKEFTGATSTLIIPSASTPYTLQTLSGGSYTEYSGDWALYDGYVEYEGEREVAITLRTAPESLTSSSGKSFNQLYLYGALEGQSITLKEDCSLRPLFSVTLASGSQLSFADVAAYDCTQLELLQALQHMFNLRFYTHPLLRRVVVEPRDEFYSEQMVDLSDRVLLSEGFMVEDIAALEQKSLRLAYLADGGGDVNRLAAQSGVHLGEWSRTLDSYIAREGQRNVVNPLFCATLSASEVVESAPSAGVLCIGDRDGESLLDRRLRVVRYEGLQPLPEGESWGYPSFGGVYPFAAFHYPKGLSEQSGAAISGGSAICADVESFTLGFGERDSIVGLHRYYDRQMEQSDRCRRVQLALRVSPDELMALCDGVSADEAIGNFRGVLWLKIAGQGAKYRLVEVRGYDARRGVARCVVERDERD